MNQTSFERGDRVRHKVTRIEGEVVQTEESLAMPHVWVTEPSVCELNPPRLYRLVDLEKVEDEDEGAQQTLQTQGVNPNLSRSNQSAQADSLTSKEFRSESVLTVEEETTTVSTEVESPVLTVEDGTTTVSTEVESPVLTVEQELVTLCSKSVSGEQIASKPLPISVKSSSPPVENTSTSNELPREPVLTVEDGTTTVSTELESPALTVENQTTTVSTKVEFSVLTVEEDTTAQLSGETTQGSNKRRKGEGTGRIQSRTITKKNSKQYQQFWYDWQVHTEEKVIYKSVYIPKRLLEKIQVLESAKAPVLEILEVLGVFGK